MRRLLLVLLFAGLALASCGGGDDQEDVEDLLDRAFSQPMSSADLKLDAELELNGSASLDRPVRLVATGPFRTNVGKLPSVDIELEVGTDGAGQTVRTGFLSTGDRAFVKFQDVYYEQPAAEVRRANRTIRRSKSREGSLGALGLDPRSWLAGGKDEGEEEVAGVQTRHVSGSLDVEAFMRNLNEFVRTSGRALGGAPGQARAEPLSAEDIQRIGEVVRDPTFDVYVGVDDDIVRRVSGRVSSPSRGQPAGARWHRVGVARVHRRVRGRERRPGDRGPQRRPAAVGAHDQPGRGRRAAGPRRRHARRPRERARARDRHACARPRARTSASTPTASTRRAPRTPTRSSAAPSCCSP